MRLRVNRRRVHALGSLITTIAVLVFLAFALTAAYSAFFDHENRVMTERSDTIFVSQEQLLARRPNSSPPEVKPTILMWTTYFGSRPTNLLDECPERCRLTYDRSLSDTAASIVFHPQDVCGRRSTGLPKTPSFDGQKFVAFTQESLLHRNAVYQGLPKSYFHWSMTYLNVSDVAFPYGGPWISREVAQQRGIPPLSITYDKEEILQQKKVRGALWFVSKCKSASGREQAISALSRNCDSVFGQYYFFVAAENAICKDYISEKYWGRVHYASVPIVMRRYIYDQQLPPKSFIAMDDFENPSAMAARLTYLMDNPDEYMTYFAWRKQGLALRYPQPSTLNDNRTWIGMCNLCARLVRGDYDKADERIPDFGQWFSSQSHCEDKRFAAAWSADSTSVPY